MTEDVIDSGESALVVIGMTAVLQDDVPKIGIGKQREILALPKRVEALAKQLVADELPRKLSMPRPFTYTRLLEQFTRPIPPGKLDAILRKFPPEVSDMALAFTSMLTNTYKHVADMLPVADIDTYLGPRRILPTSDKTFDFYNRYWIVADPLITFTLVNCGALQVEQAATLTEFFPSLYQYMKKAILDAMTARTLREPSWLMLPPRADRGFTTFMQKKVVPFGSNMRPPKDAAPPPTGAPPVTAKLPTGLQTPGQAAAGVSTS